MTHPHDTSTPTMSAESVPSEDLARRAVAQLEFHGANSGVGYSPGILFRYGRSSSLFVSELDASTLSASHLAKEGGEAWAVEAAYREGHGDALLSSMDVDTAWDASTAKADLASHSQLSPALAKGGDAVPLDFEHGGPDGYATDGRIPDTSFDWLNPNGLSDDELDGTALSTPTEGPASQTEGMGGEPEQDYPDMEERGLDEPLEEALREILLGGQGDDNGAQIMPDFQEGQSVPSMVHACIALLETRRDVIEGYANTEAQLRHRIAALTPPETAEAVPVGAGVKPFVYLREHDMRELAMPASRSRDTRIYRVPTFEGEKLHPLYSLPEVSRLQEELERRLRVGELLGEAFEENKIALVAALRERDEAVKALESVTEELGLFRDFVINNATVWTLGSNHHHPIWARVAGRLEGYTSPRDGEKWHLVRSALATEAIR